MGLALCHIVPRDLLLRLVTVCLVVSFALTIAAVAIADEKGSLAAIDGGDDLSITGRAIRGDILLCSKDLRAGSCDDFVGAAQVTHALAITSLCVLAMALALICFFVTPCAKTTTQIITALWFITFLPLAFLAATLGVGMLAVDKGNVNDNGFTVGKGMSLIIAAMALAAIAVILTTVRTILSTCTRASDKDTVLRHKDINGVMQLHAVNDDWIRQKQVLAAHAFAVKVEIREEQAANEPTGDSEGAAEPSNKGDAEAAPPVFVHHRTASHAP